MQQRHTPEQAGAPASDTGAGPGRKVRVFISYSRTDKAFAEDLVAKLAARGFEPFLDTKQILPGEPWRERLSALILTADVIVFLISPQSVLPTSVCDWELNETERLSKRLYPVVCRATPIKDVPSRLQRLNWIDMTDPAQEAARLETLSAALLTDIDWIREHTRIGEAAERWAGTRGREEHALLRGKDVDDAELWVSSRPSQAPEITELQRAFIAESRRAEQERARREREQVARTRRFQKRSAWALAGLAVLMLAGAVVTAWQFHATSLRESNVFASIADKAFQDGYCDRALRYAVAGLPPRGATPLAAYNDELERTLARYASACRLEFAINAPEIVVKNREMAKGGGGELTRLIHMTRGIGAVFSPDGALIATFLGDDAVRISEVATKRERQVIRQKGVLAVAFSPDRRLLFIGSSENTVRVFDVTTWQEQPALQPPGKGLSTFAVSPDGALVATVGDDFIIHLWDVASRQEMSSLPGHTKRVGALIFSPDGTTLLSVSGEQTAPRLWEVATGRLLAELTGHDGTVRGAAFSPDSTRVATASEDTTVRLWNAHNGSPLLTLKGHTAIVASVTFSPDGRRVATGALDVNAGVAGRDSSVRVWDARDGTQLLVLSNHTGSISGLGFTPDGKRLLTASNDRTARLWDAETGAELFLYKGHSDEIRALALAPDGSRFATASLDGATRIWSADPDRGDVVLPGLLAEPPETSFSPDGSLVVTGGQDGSLALTNLRTGSVLTLEGHTKAITCAAFSRDGRRLVTGSADGTARVWDTANGAAIAVLLGHGDTVTSVAFNADGTQVLSRSDDRSARLWDAASGSELKVLREGDDEFVYNAMFMPGSGDIVTLLLGQGGAKVWDSATGRVSRRLASPADNADFVTKSMTQPIFGVATPDGRTLIIQWTNMSSTHVFYENYQPVWQFGTPLGDRPRYWFGPNIIKAIVGTMLSNTARVVDLTERREITTLRGHTSFITGEAFSPDGRRIVTQSRDHTIRIWDADTGSEIGRLPDERDGGRYPIFTPDGRQLVVQYGASQKTVLRNLDPVNFVAAGERRDYVCRERLVGAGAFSDREMEDPILQSRDDLRNPCQAFGPFTLAFYTGLFGSGGD